MRVKLNNLAGWQSGHAADCKSVYAGSIPASASKLNENCLNSNYNTYLLEDRIYIKQAFRFSPGGGIGRHKGFKIPRRQLRAGSSPALGTIPMILS